ncbi:MAG: MBL fold metallo-hydrolase [Anaerococcus sp.]
MLDKIVVTYVYHSCYTVEIGDYFLIFDYFKGKLDIPDDKKVIFIASHGHSDHYTSEILKIPGMESYTYILSSDIGKLETDDNIIYIKDNKLGIDQLKSLYNSKNVHFLRPDQYKDISFKDKTKISLKTFGSTDLGISILLYIDGISIFHSGDLNFWAWPDNDEKTMQDEYNQFMVEIEKIKKNDIDISFFPVDYRLKENYYKGAEIFAKEVKPQIMFPLHSGEHEDISQKFAKEHKTPGTAFRPILGANQKIVVDINPQ